MSDDRPTDRRMQVVFELLPEHAIFLHTYDRDLLWRPNSRGYVSEYNPFFAGLYTSPKSYKPRGEDVGDHSYVLDVREWMGGWEIQDETIAAFLVDEILRLRERIDELERR